MSSVNRVNRKATDEDIIRLNNLGLSLATIGKMLNVHSTTITLRLKALGIEPADTRRSFMEDVYKGLTVVQQDWLADQLSSHHTVKDFVRNLIAKEFTSQNRPAKAA